MGAFDNYLAGRIMRDNPNLVAEYNKYLQAQQFAQQTPYVMGTPEQGTKQAFEHPQMEGEAPIEGLWETSPDYQPASAGGLWDESLSPEDRELRMTQRAGMSGAPAFQQLANANLQNRSSAIMGQGSDTLGFGAARRMIQDESGDQFWVGNVTNKRSGEMETVYSPIGHDKTAPKGRVELIDEMGLTSGEKLDWKASEKQIMAQTDKDVGFYLEYPKAMSAAEDAVHELEFTMRDAAELYGATDHSTAGFGSWIAGIPLTGATDWAGLKSTVVSRLALTKMMMLKAASSTGATGFGSLSERELKVLQDNLASLEQSQSPKKIKSSIVKVLKDLERSRQRLKNAAADDRQKYVRLHSRFKGPEAPLSESVQRRMDEEAQPAKPAGNGIGVTPSGIQYRVVK